MQTPLKEATVKSTKTSPVFNRLVKKTIDGCTSSKFKKGATLFSQGEKGDAIYFIQTGQVQLTVVSKRGRQAVLAMLGPHDFLGEECLVRDSRRTSTAACQKPSTVYRIRKDSMLQALHAHPKLSEEFMTSLLGRNIDLEEELREQLFNHSERRLACALLKLSRAGRQHPAPDATLPKVTQKMLAMILGTTGSEVNAFMKKFRRLGLIDYRGVGDITVRSEAMIEAVLRA